jgi:hypothetical protein
MSAAETKTRVGYEVIDHNIVPDLYVTYIVDVWEGDRSDPATGVTRFIGVWRAEDLETEERGAFDPDFTQVTDYNYRYSYSRGSRSWRKSDTPEPLVWEVVETTKEADEGAQKMRSEYENMTDPEARAYTYGAQRIHKDLYVKFLDAVDILAEDPDNEEAWEDVKAFRDNQALKHEK